MLKSNRTRFKQMEKLLWLMDKRGSYEQLSEAQQKISKSLRLILFCGWFNKEV